MFGPSKVSWPGSANSWPGPRARLLAAASGRSVGSLGLVLGLPARHGDLDVAGSFEARAGLSATAAVSLNAVAAAPEPSESMETGLRALFPDMREGCTGPLTEFWWRKGPPLGLTSLPFCAPVVAT